VIQLKQTVRRAVLVVAVLGVAAASAAMWNQYAPISVCLYCGAPEHYAPPLNKATPRAAAKTGGANAARHSGELSMPPKPKVMPEVPSEPPSHSEGGGSVQADAPRGWQPWNDDNGPDRPRQASGGPLWFTMVEMRQMVMGGRYGEPGGGIATALPKPSHDQQAQDHPAGSLEVVEPHPGPPSGAAGPNPGDSGSNPTPPNQGPGTPQGPGTSPNTGPTAGSPTAPGAPGPSGETPSSEPPTNPFVEHTTPPADPFVPPRPVGSLDPAGPGGGVTPSDDGPAATPEPASVLLIATGLLFLFTDLRRRHAI